MKVITYWETAPGRTIPPYVALGIASLKVALGDAFLFLTKYNAPSYIGSSYLEKKWVFKRHNKILSVEIASIVAKSDFVRMAYIHRHGGFWLDADTIGFENFLPYIQPSVDDKSLLWHSEQFFGANKGNIILEAAINKMLADDVQIWGNPGGIKSLVDEKPDAVSKIPFKYLNPGCTPTYSYQNCQILLEKLPVEEFLKNPEAKLMKMYNSDFSAFDISRMSLDDFFDSGALISQIFLKINPKVDFWKDQVEQVIAETEE